MNERKTWLVVNAASGSNDDEAVKLLTDALAGAGARPDRVVCLPDDDLPDAASLEAAGVGLLVTFTGDGTANAQVARLHGWAGKVLVLPGGTQNLLAKRLHGDRSAEEAVAALAGDGLVPVRLDMIRSAHGDALCEIVIGPGAKWSDVRETMRDGDVAGIAQTLADAIRQSAGGPTVAVSEPELGKSEGYPAVRLSPADGSMKVDGYGAEGFGDYARQGVAILRRDFRTGPHDELGKHKAVTCRSSEPIELMLDGERATGAMEERFETAPCPVEFLGHPD
jgi:diacylglycerol kinase family enzyme